MATREDQPEALVGDLLRVVSQPLERAQFLSLSCFDSSHAFASQPIDRLVARSEDDPPRGVVRDSLLRPGAQSLHERVLYRLFGQVEASGSADQSRDRPSRLTAEQEVDVGACIGRVPQPSG